MRFMMWVVSTAGICEFRPTGKGLTFTIATFRQHFDLSTLKPVTNAVVMSESYPKHSLRSRGRLSPASPEGAYSWWRRPRGDQGDTCSFE